MRITQGLGVIDKSSKPQKCDLGVEEGCKYFVVDIWHSNDSSLACA